MTTAEKTNQEVRDIIGAVGVLLRGGGKLVITQGDEESLMIEADEQLLPQIKTSVQEGVAVIEFEKNITIINGKTTPTFYITLREITQVSIEGGGIMRAEAIDTGRLRLSVSGGGQVKVDDLNAKSLEVDISGAGDFNLAGEAKHQDVSISGAGNYRAGHLRTEHTSITISGAGNGNVWAESTLVAQISGVGRIGYYGSPDVKKRRDGIGMIKHLGGKPKA